MNTLQLLQWGSGWSCGFYMPLYYNIVIISEIYESDEGEFPHGQRGRETGLRKKRYWNVQDAEGHVIIF